MATYLDLLPKELIELLEEYVTSHINVRVSFSGCTEPCCRDAPREYTAVVTLNMYSGSTATFNLSAQEYTWRRFIQGGATSIGYHYCMNNVLEFRTRDASVTLNQQDTNILRRKISNLLKLECCIHPSLHTSVP